MFPTDCCFLSVDDKAKLPVDGTPVVSRLVQGRKFFSKENFPDLPDHDHRSGLLVVPNGYMDMNLMFNQKEVTEPETEETLFYNPVDLIE